jgi:hypothetical protein
VRGKPQLPGDIQDDKMQAMTIFKFLNYRKACRPGLWRGDLERFPSLSPELFFRSPLSGYLQLTSRLLSPIS